MKERDVYFLDGEEITSDNLTDEHRKRFYEVLVETYGNTPVAERSMFFNRVIGEETQQETDESIDYGNDTIAAMEFAWHQSTGSQRDEMARRFMSHYKEYFLKYAPSLEGNLGNNGEWYFLISINCQSSFVPHGKIARTTGTFQFTNAVVLTIPFPNIGTLTAICDGWIRQNIPINSNHEVMITGCQLAFIQPITREQATEFSK